MPKIILISGYMCDETIWQSTIKTFKDNNEIIINKSRQANILTSRESKSPL
mgnify:CR=1 FL=1